MKSGLEARMPVALVGSLLALLGADVNAFGVDVYRNLMQGSGNRVFSPASVSAALTMAWGGARGETAEEMRRVLHLQGAPDDVLRSSGAALSQVQQAGRGVTFRVANRLFGEGRYRFEPAYLDLTKTAYGAPLQAVDFRGAPEKARGVINGWVEARTEKRITDLVPAGSVTGDTRLVLVNAIYFLGDWARPFAKEATRPLPFRLSPAATKDVPTMRQTETFGWMRGDGFQALEMAYQGNAFSLVVILPDAVDGLSALEDQLTADMLARIAGALTPKRVAVALPKFEVNPPESLPLSRILEALGMKAAFDPRRADFTGIANPPDPGDRLFVSEVFHKAFVKTDEKGTEAAAASAVMMPRVSSMPIQDEPIPFRADHPFLFLMRDKASGLVLFMGRVSDPSSR
jgi:serine protease inhibitor